jgi:hypothetical protein
MNEILVVIPVLGMLFWVNLQMWKSFGTSLGGE